MKKTENISQEEFERIEKYILKKLPEQEFQVFEKELERNPELRNEVKIQRKMMLAVEAGELRMQLDNFYKKYFGQSNTIRWFAVAASVLILITAGIWWALKPDKAESLFAANVTIEPGLPVPMSATNNYVFYDAMVDYKSEKYEKAISKWQALLNAEPMNDTLNYFVGVAFFNDEKYELAISSFEKVQQIEKSAFYGKSEWYMALSFLKTKNFVSLNNLAEKSQSENSIRIRELNQKLE